MITFSSSMAGVLRKRGKRRNRASSPILSFVATIVAVVAATVVIALLIG